MTHVLAIDQGTTSTRSIVFDAKLKPVASAQQEFQQHFPQSGWVEHEPTDLLRTTVDTLQAALAKANVDGSKLAAIGITNQRETTVVWDRTTGEVIARAIVWQDRRTAEQCLQLRADGLEELVRERTGLLLDPYFSATKVAWILDQVTGARRRAEAGELAFGTVDSYLIWGLTGGRVHVTDATNAARTLLFDIHRGEWDPELCSALRVPMAMLPSVRDCAGEFAITDANVVGASVAIRGVAGDQQAASVGQACFQPGMLKSTYGTGCFALLNTGEHAVKSSNRLLTTIAYQLGGVRSYALEGSIFVAGSVVQWLRDGLKIIASAADTQALAERADPNQQLYLVPAFVGLGAPYWDAQCRGAVYGLTRATGPAELARAALESVGYQTRDLIEAMHRDMADSAATVLRVDGGMSASEWTMQFLADVLGAPVDRPQVLETTAVGAAWLAGMASGIYPGRDRFATAWALDRRFTPSTERARFDALYQGWTHAVQRTLSTPSS